MLAPIIALTLAAAPVAATEVHEDEPAFNCYTMGNEGCGTSIKIDGGAVLAKANDERVYISWKDGRVTRASEKYREFAWTACVVRTWDDPTDANLQACDEDYMEAGDAFRMSHDSEVYSVRDEDGLAEAFEDSISPEAKLRDWDACSIVYGDTTLVVCPDGWVEVS